MALMTDDMQEKLIKLLTDEGLVSRDVIKQAAQTAKQSNTPLLAMLTSNGTIDEELLTHAIAQVSGVPYINLTSSIIAQ